MEDDRTRKEMMKGEKAILREVGKVRSNGMQAVRNQEGREPAETGREAWSGAVEEGRKQEQSAIICIYEDTMMTTTLYAYLKFEGIICLVVGHKSV